MHVYFNNLSATVDLALDLFRSGLYSYGMLRINHKGFPVALKSAGKRSLSIRGESKTRNQVNLTAFVWQDN